MRWKKMPGSLARGNRTPKIWTRSLFCKICIKGGNMKWLAIASDRWRTWSVSHIFRPSFPIELMQCWFIVQSSLLTPHFKSHALQHASPAYHHVGVHGFLHVTFDMRQKNVCLSNHSFISLVRVIRSHVQSTVWMTGVVETLSHLLCLKLPSCQCLPWAVCLSNSSYNIKTIMAAMALIRPIQF